MIRLLRDSGFVVEHLSEVQPGSNAPGGFDNGAIDWDRRWPSEEVWKARRMTGATESRRRTSSPMERDGTQLPGTVNYVKIGGE